MTRTPQDRKGEYGSIKTAMFGLAGTSVAFLFQILGQTSLDRPLEIALYSFVVSIPLLVSLAITMDIARNSAHRIIPERAMITLMLLWMAPSLAAFGLASYLWHYSVGAAIAFAAAIILGFVLFMHFQVEFFREQTRDAEAE